MITIYSLSDPVTGVLRYVGKTSSKLSRRLQAHMREKTHCHRTMWIKSLGGASPVIEAIEECNQDNWEEVERFWIAYFKSVGAKLVNQTIGGDGPGKFSPEVIQKMRLAQLGKKRPPYSQAHRDAISRANKGKSRKGHKWSEAQHRIFKEQRTGRRHSLLSRMKMSETRKRPVFQFSTGMIYDSAAEAFSAAGLNNKEALVYRIKRGNDRIGRDWAYLDSLITI